MNNKSNVTVGAPKVTGAIFIGKTTDTVVPTDATSPLSDQFLPLGYVSEDGVTLSEERDSEEMKAWGGDVVRTTVSKYMEKCTFTPIETNENVAKFLYGEENVEVKDEGGNKTIVIKHTDAELPMLPLVIETVAGKGIIKRYVAPAAQLVEKGDITLDGNSADGREATINCYKDKDGVTLYDYTTFVKTAARGGRK